MENTESTFHPAAEMESSRGHIATLAVQVSLLLGEMLALIWLIERLASSDWVQATCLAQFLLAMSAASASLYCAAVRRRRLYDPMRRLETLLPEIRAGRVPMEDLSNVEGRLGPIARHIQELLREIRLQKGMMAEMDREIKQKIANRTEALERKIGSLHNQATHDALTGLLNRRALDEHLAKAMERCCSKGMAISVMMIDVDNFKPLNDTLGHAAGDDLLRSIGQLLRSTLRDSDTAFRCGGDEFVVVLEGSDSSGATALADRLTKLVDGLTKTLKVAKQPRLSIGSASAADVLAPTAEALLEEADKRLYAVKGDRKRGGGPAPAPTKSAIPLRKTA